MRSAQPLQSFGANLFRSFGEVIRDVASWVIRRHRAARKRQLERALRRGMFCVD
jgi:hypothetical protein